MDENTPPSPDSTPLPTPDLLAQLYRHLPVLVVHLAADGSILHVNPAALRATGYAEADLLGKNFWALLFPGRLFAQVPKFISAAQPMHALADDVPMTLRMKNGNERVIAWSRFIHDSLAAPSTDNPGVTHFARSIVCIGKDLTDRLLDADNDTQPPRQSVAFGPPIGNLGTVDGDIITPLAISPPSSNEPPAAIQQVHDFLTDIDLRIDAMQTAVARGEIDSLVTIATCLSHGAHACGLLDFSSRAESLRQAATLGSLPTITSIVEEIVALCRPKMS